MIPSNTICVSQEGPANALALNKDCTQVVIAGRNVFKVFSIGETEFSEVCNLRVGKNLNLNFSSIDVAWSTIEENTVATAATNGAVVVWNLGRSGRSKQEHVFSDHKRTVNKVSFHLTEPSLLISGSQDGMMKCFDLRMKEVARTFISNTESVRDVQFSPHSAHVFAAVSENGNVQLWDVRRHERCLHQYTAHSGPVFACDWHPDCNWLATASRDKTIKVWDIHGKPTLEHTIYTIASVGHVKWRPQRKYQISSCALVLDCAVHVWDVRRPHVPLATFAEHRDVTTAIAWQASPHAFLSTSRDCSLYRHRFSEAAHPVLWSPAVGAALSARGQLAQACPSRRLQRPCRDVTASVPSADHVYHPQTGRKQPTAGSLSASAQSELERVFPISAHSVMTRWQLPDSPLLHCATHYRFRGAPVQLLAEHNAKVARDCDKHMTAHVWEVIAAIYSSQSSEQSDSETAPGAAPVPARPDPPLPPPPPLIYSAVTEEPAEETEQWAESQFHNSGVLGLPTHTIYIPPAKSKRPDLADATGWVSAASAHYVDIEAADWTLPEEAFPLRAPSSAPLPLPQAPPTAQTLTTQHHQLSTQHSNEDEQTNGGGGGSSASPGGSTGGSSASTGAPTLNRTYSQQSSINTMDETYAGSLSVRLPPGVTAELHVSLQVELHVAPLLAAALRLHADLGDLQTSATALLALQSHRTDLFPYIDESMQEQWLLGYIELLQRHKLYNIATEVVRCSWLGSVWSLSQQSTSVCVSCARCGRRTRLHAPCDRCPPPTSRPPLDPPAAARSAHDLCAVCKQTVRGLFAWCQGCSHGGHVVHMQRWMEKHRLCPAGCGHHCQL